MKILLIILVIYGIITLLTAGIEKRLDEIVKELNSLNMSKHNILVSLDIIANNIKNINKKEE